MPTKKGHGKYIETPEKLMEYFEKYRSWRKKNGRKLSYYSKSVGDYVDKIVEAPVTWTGFQVWLRQNKIINGLEDYEKNDDGRYGDYAHVIRAIKDEIYEDKYTGAVCGLFKENIIARDLGLMERTDHTTKGDKMEFPTEIKITRVEPKSE
jgi:hypothetical protein